MRKATIEVEVIDSFEKGQCIECPISVIDINNDCVCPANTSSCPIKIEPFRIEEMKKTGKLCEYCDTLEAIKKSHINMDRSDRDKMPINNKCKEAYKEYLKCLGWNK